jgi:hypothetical protein
MEEDRGALLTISDISGPTYERRKRTFKSYDNQR